MTNCDEAAGMPLNDGDNDFRQWLVPDPHQLWRRFSVRWAGHERLREAPRNCGNAQIPNFLSLQRRDP